MGDRHRGVLVQQQLGHRFADYIAAAYDYGTLAFDALAGALDQPYDALRRAGDEALAPQPQIGDVGGMEAVHVFFGHDGVDYTVFVDMAGEGKLDQDSVYGCVGVQAGDRFKQSGLAYVFRELDEPALHSGEFGRLDFPAHVGAACRIVAHDNHCQAGHTPAFALYRFDF